MKTKGLTHALTLSTCSLLVSSALAGEPQMQTPMQTPIEPARPNVILIVADDMGYADAGFQQISQDVHTPNLNAIAQSGAIMKTGYVTAPVCGPSRAGMLTGRYQQRFGYYSNTSPYTLNEHVEPGIPLDIPTIGNYFQQAGYTTGFVGKYHDGVPKEYWPHNRGFDDFLGFNNGAAAYSVGSKNIENAEETPNSSIWRNDQLVENFDDYLTDKFGQEAVHFIERHKQSPFFLYVPFNAIHTPLKALEEDMALFAHIEDINRRKSVAMSYSLDKNIGQILATLEDNQLRDNTMIIFLADNGGKPDSNHSYNHPLKGYKSTMWEGGIRVPFAISWPSQIPANQTITDPIISLDILPTVLSAAGVDTANLNLDGINLLPRLKGDVATLENRFLYWDRDNKAAIRDNDWKMIKLINKKARYELYNISQDNEEQHDLAKTEPEQLARMQKALADWQATNMPAQWGGDPEKFPHLIENWK